MTRSANWAGLLVGAASVLAGALGWQLLTQLAVLPAGSFPTTLDILGALGRELRSSGLWSSIAYTLESWALGLLISAVLAIPLGLLLGVMPWAYRSCRLIIEFLKPIPVVAILPLAMVLFGPTMRMKLLLICFGTVWPLFTQVIYGVQDIDAVQMDTARAFKLTRWERLRFIRLPSAAPFLATGFRLAATTALVLSLVAELLGGGDGIGQAINAAENGDALAEMYALVVVVGILGLLMTRLFEGLERPFLYWHPSQRGAVA